MDNRSKISSRASQRSRKSATNFLGTTGNPKEDYSPFKPPNEEQVFITREAEKQKKLEEKEAAKHLKIWDKKTATSRMPLKRVKDSDINPHQSDENVFNFNNSQRGYISAAMHIAKSRVQFPRESRPQNINEFVDQKKEMFLVELSYNTIKTEITDLSLKKNRKANALQESSSQLTKDNEKLVNFIENDTMTMRDRNKEAEQALNNRKQAEGQIKLLDQKIQNVKTDIDKNIELMNALDSHKDFLFKIFKTEDPKWVEAMLLRREKKLQEIKSDWIEMAKHNKILDDDEMSLKNEKLPSLAEHTSHSHGRRKPEQHRQMTYADWEHEFDRRLKNDQIDVPADYYDEDVLF